MYFDVSIPPKRIFPVAAFLSSKYKEYAALLIMPWDFNWLTNVGNSGYMPAFVPASLDGKPRPRIPKVLDLARMARPKVTFWTVLVERDTMSV